MKHLMRMCGMRACHLTMRHRTTYYNKWPVMSATLLDANRLAKYSACSVFLQLGLGIVHKLCTNGDNSSLFLEPGMDVKNQMFVQLKVHGQVFCSTAQGFSVEEVYNIFYQVDEILLLRCFQSKEWVMQTRS